MTWKKSYSSSNQRPQCSLTLSFSLSINCLAKVFTIVGFALHHGDLVLTLLQQLLHGPLLVLLSAMATAQQHHLRNGCSGAHEPFPAELAVAPRWGSTVQQEGFWEIPIPAPVCDLFPVWRVLGTWCCHSMPPLGLSHAQLAWLI